MSSDWTPEAGYLRHAIRGMVSDWEDVSEFEAQDLLAHTFGYEHYYDFLFGQTDEDTALLKKLHGPHGYTLWKVLRLRS